MYKYIIMQAGSNAKYAHYCSLQESENEAM